MTHDEMRAAIEIIGGGTRRGMLKAAEARLDISRQTMHRAYNDGKFTTTLADRVTAAADVARAREKMDLSLQAGSWSVGHVDNRQGGTDVVDESVVLHLANPSFVLHVEMLRGKGPDGGARWSERVRWYEEPRDDVQRQMLLKIAQEKGQASIYERSQASADIRMREHKTTLAVGHGAIEKEELMKLGPLALSVEAEGVDVTTRLAEMNAEIQSRHVELSGDLCRASLDLGQWIMAHKIGLIAMQDTEQTDIPAYVTAKAHRLLPQAHKNTVRGQRTNLGGGVHDEIVLMSAPTRTTQGGLHVGMTSYDVTVDHFADLPDDDLDPEIEGRKRAAAAVRAQMEGRYAYNALNDAERAVFDMKMKEELSAAAM